VHEVEVVALRPPFALELLGHIGDDVVLLRVHRHDAAVLRHLREDAPEVAVRHADRAEGRENLEARDPRLDRLADLADRLRRDLTRQDVVEREVGVGVAADAEDGAPPLDALGDGHARGVGRGRQVEIAREVDDRRHAAEGSGAGGRRGRLGHDVGLPRPHLRHGDVDVRVRLDAAGDDDLAAGVDRAATAGQRARPAERSDLLALHPDVHVRDALRRHDLPTCDHEIEHGAPPRMPVPGVVTSRVVRGPGSPARMGCAC